MTTPTPLSDPTEAQVRAANVIAALSEAITRRMYASGFQTFDGKRDISREAGYPQHITTTDYWTAYRRGGVAGTIVDKFAETTWRKSPEVTDADEAGEETPFSKGWKEIRDRLHVFRAMEQADKLARIGRYSVLLLGFRATDDEYRQPVRRMSNPADLLYLQSYDEGRVSILQWVTDPRDPAYGLPLEYTLQTATESGGFSGAVPSIVAHRSRVIHVAENTLRDRVFGRPALERPWNDLIDYQKIASGTAEAFWQRVVAVMQGIIDPEAQLTEPEVKAYTEALQALQHGLGRIVAQKGAKLEKLIEDEPDPTGAAKLSERRIAAATDYPARILFGSETGERASSEDQKSFFGSVGERQIQYAEPVLLRPFVDRLVEVGILPAPRNGKYSCVWPPLAAESEDTVASANFKRAQAAAALTPVGGDPLALVEIDENRDIWLVPRKHTDPSPFDIPDQPDDSEVDLTPAPNADADA
jgi:hypothetical protein